MILPTKVQSYFIIFFCFKKANVLNEQIGTKITTSFTYKDFIDWCYLRMTHINVVSFLDSNNLIL